MLFADISGSTALYERLGDVAARKQVADCLAKVTEQVGRYGGEVIKPIGDEVMCGFPDAESAVGAAIAMHKVLAEDERTAAESSAGLSIRVGLHFGSVIQDAGDVFGDTVNVAARMAALAKAGQIVTTQATIEGLSPELRDSTRLLDHSPVKGKKKEITVFEVIWQHEDVTNLATSLLLTPRPVARLLLRYQEKEVQLDHDHPSVSVGRSQPCDMIVDNERASRQHARIEHRRGKYFIIDQSTNGTYVRFEDGEQAFLRREEIVLRGRGMINLGSAFEKSSGDPIHFVCES